MATTATGAEARAERKARNRVIDPRQLGMLMASHTVDDLYQGAVPAIIPFLILERGYSYTAAAGITLAATVLSSVVQPLFGVFADKRHMPWLPAVGLLVAGIGVGLAGLGTQYWQVWCAIALSGVGVAAYHPAAAKAARLAAGTSAQGMSWFAVGGNIGLALGPALATPLLLALGLMSTPILVIPAVIMAVVFLAFNRRVKERMRNRPVAKPKSGESQTDDWRSFRWLTAMVIMRSIVYFGMSTLIAVYVIREFSASKAVGAAVLTSFLGLGAASTVGGGWLADRIGRVPTIRIGYAVAIPALVFLLLAPNTPLAWVAAVLVAFGIYCPFSVQTTLSQDYLPNYLGTASGVTIGLAVSAGGMFAPVLGLIGDHYGLHWAIATLLLGPICALLISLRLRDRVHV